MALHGLHCLHQPRLLVQAGIRFPFNGSLWFCGTEVGDSEAFSSPLKGSLPPKQVTISSQWTHSPARLGLSLKKSQGGRRGREISNLRARMDPPTHSNDRKLSPSNPTGTQAPKRSCPFIILALLRAKELSGRGDTCQESQTSETWSRRTEA